jgi:hypothetical protein
MDCVRRSVVPEMIGHDPLPGLPAVPVHEVLDGNPEERGDPEHGKYFQYRDIHDCHLPIYKARSVPEAKPDAILSPE